MALKLFELEVPVLRASKELGLAYNTVHKLFTLIREHIYRASSKDNLLSEESFWGKNETRKSCLFYIS